MPKTENVVQTAAPNKNRLPKQLETRRPLDAEEGEAFVKHLDWTTIAPPVAALAILRQPEISGHLSKAEGAHIEEGVSYFGDGPAFRRPIDVEDFWEAVLAGVKKDTSYAAAVKEWHLMATRLTRHILSRINVATEPDSES